MRGFAGHDDDCGTLMSATAFGYMYVLARVELPMGEVAHIQVVPVSAPWISTAAAPVGGELRQV